MNEHQFVLMINCIEDISRFMAGQTELFHTILNLPNYLEVKDKMGKTYHRDYPYITRNCYFEHKHIYCIPYNDQTKHLLGKTGRDPYDI